MCPLLIPAKVSDKKAVCLLLLSSISDQESSSVLNWSDHKLESRTFSLRLDRGTMTEIHYN